MGIFDKNIENQGVGDFPSMESLVRQHGRYVPAKGFRRDVFDYAKTHLDAQGFLSLTLIGLYPDGQLKRTKEQIEDATKLSCGQAVCAAQAALDELKTVLQENGLEEAYEHVRGVLARKEASLKPARQPQSAVAQKPKVRGSRPKRKSAEFSGPKLVIANDVQAREALKQEFDGASVWVDHSGPKRELFNAAAKCPMRVEAFVAFTKIHCYKDGLTYDLEEMRSYAGGEKEVERILASRDEAVRVMRQYADDMSADERAAFEALDATL